MTDRSSKINSIVESIQDVIIIKPFELSDSNIKGCISVFTEGLEKAIQFNVEIYPQYPFKSYDFETIKFYNRDLLEVLLMNHRNKLTPIIN